MSDEPRDENPAEEPSTRPSEDLPAPGSAPWERSRRWSSDRLDATRVDDLLARLGSDEPATPRRRRRSDRAPIEHTDPVSTPDLPSSASEPTADQPTPPEPAGPVVPGLPTSPVSENATASFAEDSDPTVPAVNQTGVNLVKPVLPTGNSPEDRTEVLPRIVISQQNDDQVDDVRQSLRAHLVAQEPSQSSDPAATPPVSDSGHRPHRTVMIAGRSLIALLSALVMVYVGAYWVVIHNTANVGTVIQGGLGDGPQTNPKTVITSTGPVDPTADTQAPISAPFVSYNQENFLIFGSDSRAGDNGDPSNDDGTLDGIANTDTMMVAHISADRSQISIVSLPRDLWIDDLTCETWDETNQRYTGEFRDAVPGGKLHLNSPYSIGGAKCLVDAVEQVTGLQITRFLGIGFNGFKSMVDALGGVQVNACGPISDSLLGPILATGGIQKINGTQALNLARARYVDPTADLGRIHRQQILLASILNEAKSVGVLLNPIKLGNFVNSFFADTIRANVEVEDLLALADSMGDLDPARVTFYTLPTFNDNDGRSLLLDKVNSGLLFDALRADTPVPGAVLIPTTTTSQTSGTEVSIATSVGSSDGSTTPSTTTSSTTTTPTTTTPEPPTLTVAPGDISVQLVNAADRDGLSTNTSVSLNNLGFNITEDDLLRLEPSQVQSGITVRYSPENLAAALTVASTVPGSVLVRDATLGDRVALVLGTDFDGQVLPVAVGDLVRADLAASIPVTTTTATGSSQVNSSAAETTDASTTSTDFPTTANDAAVTTENSETATTVEQTPEVSSVNAGSAGCL